MSATKFIAKNIKIKNAKQSYLKSTFCEIDFKILEI